MSSQDIILTDAPPATTTASPASIHIKELNAIDHDISQLLLAASQSLRTLTTIPPSLPNFTTHSARYHSLLSSIVVRLRRQILLLEQADIPAPADGTDESGKQGGGIDVGAFNSRNDVVGREMEAELWRNASVLLKSIESMEGVGGASEGK
ncbi:uncharacterized protein H6S33_009275 [Morchella sextelata]|uniref:uncharacterized protein n=1 Tax=Morchella sextelata TaxID=1174677 RepID=UPI001D03DEFB|nr:uncharacterized protein H6S33_009275 [Morchella sextelata]KAH0612895.1 hypothetical protein H6S33_009275 [Morchella sextelata]